MTEIPGEVNSADLMTKHLAIAMILRHMAKLNLVHAGGRSEAAAKLHALGESSSPTRTTARSVSFADPPPRRSLGDYWSERGERGRWVRVHVEPRSDKFDPWRAPRGPGRKTKLKPWRTTEGNYIDGDYFKENDEWEVYNARKEMIVKQNKKYKSAQSSCCLLYTSDAADE